MNRFLWLALAGAAGTLCRYGLTTWMRVHVVGRADHLMPLATASVNLLGCLLFGLLVGALRARGLFDSTTAWVLAVGFLGAFTTFSSFAFESGELLAAPAGSAAWIAAIANLVLSPALGLLAYLGGAVMGRLAAS